MNCRHLTSAPGILEVVALVLCLLAASIGTASFSLSAYNKSCRDGSAENYVTPTQSTDPGSGDGSTTESSTTLRTRSPPNPQVNFGKQEQETTLTPEYKDMAPVLWMERFQISTTWIAVLVSAFLLVLYIVWDDLEYSKIYKAVNFGFHFLFMVLLIVAGIFMAYAAIEIDRQVCQHNFDKKEDCQKYIQKMGAAGLSILTAVMYAGICIKLIATKLYEEV